MAGIPEGMAGIPEGMAGIPVGMAPKRLPNPPPLLLPPSASLLSEPPPEPACEMKRGKLSFVAAFWITHLQQPAPAP